MERTVILLVIACIPSCFGCGGTLTASSGAISSPNYSQNYPNNQDCTYNIVAPIGMAVKITFTDFELESATNCKYDSVVIREVYGNTTMQRITHCGDTIPSNYTSTSNSLVINFKSDKSVTMQGFMLIYRFLHGANSSTTTAAPTITPAPSCNQTLIASSGVVTSPGYPARYPHNTVCNTNITVPAGKVVQLTFNTFDLEGESGSSCLFDYLRIIDGSDRIKLCGISMATYVSKSNELRLVFHSDSSFNGNGFNISFMAVLASASGCNQSLNSSSGEVTSPGYPAKYPHNKDCTTKITVPAGNVVQLTFDTFDVEIGYDCPFDYLMIVDGSNRRKLCGNRVSTYISKTNELDLVFHSDSPGNGNGFKIYFMALEGPTILPPTTTTTPTTTTAPSCNQDLTASSGVVTSPGYPAAYPNSKDCTTKITVPAGKVIQLTFNTFDVEGGSGCPYDYLMIIDGSNRRKLCGSSVSTNHTSKSNVLNLVFHSDSSVNKYGYMISFMAIVAE